MKALLSTKNSLSQSHVLRIAFTEYTTSLQKFNQLRHEISTSKRFFQCQLKRCNLNENGLLSSALMSSCYCKRHAFHCLKRYQHVQNFNPKLEERRIRCMSTVPQAPSDENYPSLHQDKMIQKQEKTDLEITHPENPSESESSHFNGHVPVLVKETLKALAIKDGQTFVDMTFGAGGHAREITKSAKGLKYIASDRDPLAFEKAKQFSSSSSSSQVIPVLSKFSELASELQRLNIGPGSVDAFLMDLGASSMQFDTSERGFSLSRDGPLDMRMDGHRYPDSPTAADVINTLDPGEISQILKKYGEESHALEIAHAIVEARYAFGKFTRTLQLANVIKAVFESSFRHDRLHRHAHIATKTFQALRIFVNDELNEINNGLELAHHYLKPYGRCVAISFHSLEDRIVKRHFHDIVMDEKPNLPARYHVRNVSNSYDLENIKKLYLSGPWKALSRKVIEASPEEVSRNPRSRSAKLRAAIKTPKQ